MSTRHLTSPAEIADMISSCEAAGFHHHTPLFRAALTGRINVLFPERKTRMPPLWRMERHRRPIVVIVGDDDYGLAGPTGWASAEKLRSWAAFAIVHGSGGQAEHYEMAVHIAEDRERVLFVETTSAATDEWGVFLSKRAELPIIGILCTASAHPVMLGKGARH